MKSFAPCLLLLSALLAPLPATPERVVIADEQFVGSNRDGFAILRSQNDNLGNHYKYRKTTWLVEYAKDSKLSAEPHRTLLLDVTYHVDAMHMDPNTLPAVTETINSQDTTLPWASILQRYPDRTSERWASEKLIKLRIHPVDGIRFNLRVLLISGDAITRQVFGDRLSDCPWTLDEITEDSNTLFLLLTKSDDNGNRESRLVGLAPSTTREVRDQIALKPLYLVAGTYESRDEAMRETQALLAKARELKFYGFHPEVWSLRLPSDRTVHVIAETYSMELIENGRLPQVKEKLGIDLAPMTSKYFSSRTLVNP